MDPFGGKLKCFSPKFDHGARGEEGNVEVNMLNAVYLRYFFPLWDCRITGVVRSNRVP